MTEPGCAACYGPTNPSPAEQAAMPVKRFSAMIGLKPEKEQYYRELQAAVWPGIVDRLRKSNVKNYSIHVADIEGRKYLVSYLEYTGTDYEADMAAIAADPETQRWWQETDPCQFLLPARKPGSNWSDLELVF